MVTVVALVLGPAGSIEDLHLLIDLLYPNLFYSDLLHKIQDVAYFPMVEGALATLRQGVLFQGSQLAKQSEGYEGKEEDVGEADPEGQLLIEEIVLDEGRHEIEDGRPVIYDALGGDNQCDQFGLVQYGLLGKGVPAEFTVQVVFRNQHHDQLIITLLIADYGVIGGQFVTTQIELLQVFIVFLQAGCTLFHRQQEKRVGVVVVVSEVDIDQVKIESLGAVVVLDQIHEIADCKFLVVVFDASTHDHQILATEQSQDQEDCDEEEKVDLLAFYVGLNLV